MNPSRKKNYTDQNEHIIYVSKIFKTFKSKWTNG